MSQRVVYKYQLAPPGGVRIQRLPVERQLAAFGMDGAHQLCVWFEVNADGPEQDVRLAVIPTGTSYDADESRWLASVIVAPYVWHLLEGQTVQ